MKSLVTGAAGFIGSHLVEKLLGAGHDVVGVDSFLDNYPRHFKENNLASFIEHPKFTFFSGDLTRIDLKKLLQDVDYVFHLAGQPGVRSSWGSEFSRYTENNISATQLLLEAAKDLKARQIRLRLDLVGVWRYYRFTDARGRSNPAGVALWRHQISRGASLSSL